MPWVNLYSDGHICEPIHDKKTALHACVGNVCPHLSYIQSMFYTYLMLLNVTETLYGGHSDALPRSPPT